MQANGQLWIGGSWLSGMSTLQVTNKFWGTAIAEVHQASREQVARAVREARDAQGRYSLAPYDRYSMLTRAADILERWRAEVLQTMVDEAGFTLRDARGELERSLQTLALAAEEAKRIVGEVVPLAAAPGAANRLGFTVRHPIGVVCAITPFNSPLNTVIHKVAPALAAGNSVVLKPSTYTPLTAEILCRALEQAEVPPGYVNLLHGTGSSVGSWLLDEPSIDFYAFTGSTEVGKKIQERAGLRKTQLELGSIACTIICEDANLDWAVPRCVNAAFRKAGQVCTSVQRLYVHEEILEEVVERLVIESKTRVVGDPAEPETFVGPLIDVAEAGRVETWLTEAEDMGARIVSGGKREGSLVQPTIVRDANARMRIVCEEIFGPVVVIVPYRTMDAAIDQINSTPYGLSAGIFTSDISRAFSTAEGLRVGAVHINETSSSRVDNMQFFCV